MNCCIEGLVIGNWSLVIGHWSLVILEFEIEVRFRNGAGLIIGRVCAADKL
ncbi:MAG: hypothetical protein R2764_25790 [Bacteroidales bacterium]